MKPTTILTGGVAFATIFNGINKVGASTDSKKYVAPMFYYNSVEQHQRLPSLSSSSSPLRTAMQQNELRQLQDFGTFSYDTNENDSSLTNSITCRITVFDTMRVLEDGSVTSDEQIQCIPLLAETSDVGELQTSYREATTEYDIALPESLMVAEEESINNGLLIIEISTAAIDHNRKVLNISPTATFTVIEHNTNDARHQQILDGSYVTVEDGQIRRKLAVTGTETVAFVRIVATNGAPAQSVSQIRNQIFSSGDSFIDQFNKCSHGKMRFRASSKGNGVVQVNVNKKTSAFSQPRDIVEYAQGIVEKNLNLNSIRDLADRVIMCVPPGYGDWAGNAGVNHWRAQMNHNWCTSLTGVAHEVGHLVGLLHANVGSEAYADRSGYMGSGYPNSSWPKKCFNARNNDHFGWYDDRKVTLSPRSTNDNSKIQLATFVDYNQARNNEKVLVKLDNTYFIQYNVAKEHNAETEHNKNQVVIIQKLSNGSSKLGGLSANQAYKLHNYMGTGKTLWISACSKSRGSGGADVMQMSIAFGLSLCSNNSPTVVSDQSGCFAGTTTVDVENVPQPVKMQDLKVGDKIRTSYSGDYEPVYSFGHRSTHQMSEFVQIHTDDQSKPLEMTVEHLLYLNTNKAVRADAVRVGDVLRCLESRCTVTKVSQVQRVGIYAPLTPSGKMLVNDGILASSYVGVHTKSSMVSKLIQTAQGAHLLLSPYRVACLGISSELFGCDVNTISDGKQLYFDFGRRVVDTFEEHSFIVQLTIAVLTFIFVGTFGMLELLAGGAANVPMTIVVIIVYVSIKLYARRRPSLQAEAISLNKKNL